MTRGAIIVPTGPVAPAIGSEWVSLHQPDWGVYRVLEIRSARRARRGSRLIGPDAICARNGRTVVVPVRAFQPGGPIVPHVRREAS